MLNSDPRPIRHRSNSYDAVRFAAALSVLVSHHFALSGRPEPVLPIFHNTLGGVAVSAFFAISGFLIHKSADRSEDFASFLSARLLRIVPNLAVAASSTSLIMLLWFSNWSELNQHLRYAVYNATSFIHQVLYLLPGILTDRPNSSLNGSLWTLQYEFFMYLFIYVLCLSSARWRPVALAIAGLCAWYLWSSQGQTVALGPFLLGTQELGWLALYFIAGAGVASGWPLLRGCRAASVSCAALAATLCALSGWVNNPLFVFAVALLLVMFCESPVLARFAGGGDASYGVYLYAFPIQQLALIAIPSFWGSMGVAASLTIASGYLAWHGFEARLLRLRHPLASSLRMPFCQAGALYHRWGSRRSLQGHTDANEDK